MKLQEYILDQMIEEKSTIDELLKIDNEVCHTHMDFYELVGLFRYSKEIPYTFTEPVHFITDGDADTVYQALMSCAPMIKSIHIQNHLWGFHSWLLKRVIEYYENEGVSLSISLIDKGYSEYQKDDLPIVLYGNENFVEGIKELFLDKEIIEIKK